MNKGFVILAQDDLEATYLTCAYALTKSIKRVMPDAKVSIISNNNVIDFDNLYDKIIELPYGDQRIKSGCQFINDWQVYESSPYEYTIKLEADMYIPRSIEYWWDALKTRDVVVSTNIRDFKQNISDIKAYRRFITDNNLPDCYNGITYFRKSEMAKKFFDTVRNIFENWETFRTSFFIYITL